MENKIKVFFIIPTLYGGGAERVMSYIPQFLDKQKFDVTLIVMGTEKDGTYKVSGIPVIYFNKTRVRYAIFDLIKVLSAQKPKVVISTLSELNIVMGYISILFPKTKFIGRHTIVSQTAKKFPTKKTNFKSRVVGRIYKFGIKLLDIVLCQSVDMFNDMQVNKYEVPKHKLRIIHNPMRDDFELKSRSTAQGEVIKFITVARLVPLKGYERIISAISKLNFPFQYTIVGDGRENENIFNLINELGIKEKIVHVPYTSEVSKHLANSDFYLMGSYAEGFPNSLIESCSVGTPVIAFRAPGGLNEIIEDGINGFLVDSEAQFIEKLNNSRDWNPKEIRESIYRKFNQKKIIKDYENLFLEILD